MLLSERVETNVNYANIDRYLELGYEFEYFINKKGKKSVKRGVKIDVKVSDLSLKSGAKIIYKCDYCNKEIVVRYCDYMRHYQNGIKNDKDCCSDCIGIKTKEKLINKYGVESPFGLKEVRDKRDNTVLERYGVINVFQLDDVKEKSRTTTIEKYGAEWYVQTEEYKDRYRETCLEKYGCDNVSKSQEIIDKIKEIHFNRYGGYYVTTNEFKDKYKETCMERYGVENLFQADFVKDIITQKNIEKYGTANAMQNEEEKQRRIKIMIETKYKNNSGVCSRQQQYLQNLLNGELNYPLGKCMLDIAFVEDMIYIEYDGSGHDLRVQFGECTQYEFERKEIARKYYTKSLGWKEIRIVSNKDYLPSDKVILDIVCLSKKLFSGGNSWVKFIIDEDKYETSNGFSRYEYGNLRKIKECNLESIC